MSFVAFTQKYNKIIIKSELAIYILNIVSIIVALPLKLQLFN